MNKGMDRVLYVVMGVAAVVIVGLLAMWGEFIGHAMGLW